MISQFHASFANVRTKCVPYFIWIIVKTFKPHCHIIIHQTTTIYQQQQTQRRNPKWTTCTRIENKEINNNNSAAATNTVKWTYKSHIKSQWAANGIKSLTAALLLCMCVDVVLCALSVTSENKLWKIPVLNVMHVMSLKCSLRIIKKFWQHFFEEFSVWPFRCLGFS